MPTAALFVEGTNSNVGINTITPNSTFEVNGSFATAITTKTTTAAVTLDNTASVWYFTGAATTITFPAAATCTNRIYTIVNRSGGSRTTSSYTSLSNGYWCNYPRKQLQHGYYRMAPPGYRLDSNKGKKGIELSDKNIQSLKE